VRRPAGAKGALNYTSLWSCWLITLLAWLTAELLVMFRSCCVFHGDFYAVMGIIYFW